MYRCGLRWVIEFDYITYYNSYGFACLAWGARVPALCKIYCQGGYFICALLPNSLARICRLRGLYRHLWLFSYYFRSSLWKCTWNGLRAHSLLSNRLYFRPYRRSIIHIFLHDKVGRRRKNYAITRLYLKHHILFARLYITNGCYVRNRNSYRKFMIPKGLTLT